jgi:hypothetical protein
LPQTLHRSAVPEVPEIPFMLYFTDSFIIPQHPVGPGGLSGFEVLPAEDRASLTKE